MMQINQLIASLSELFQQLKAKLKNGMNNGSYEEELLKRRGQLVPVPVKNGRTQR